MTGYTGKSIRVDLSGGVWDIFETPPELCEKFIGGRGFGVALIREHITKPFDSEDMPIIFASGPLVGTSAPTSGRLSVVSRSPLTSTVFDSSVGGRFATELKRAGFDMLIVSGLSREWVMIDIQDNNISIKDARPLQGRNVEETAAILGDDGSTAIIGRAGERGVRFASIVFDGHYLAGRGGLGAVMGAKRLKAIKIRGTGEVKVADPGALKKAREEIMRLLRASPAVFGEFGLSEFGTAALVDLIHARRMEPTENFRKSVFPQAGQYSGYSMKTAYHTRKKGCRGCPILCKKVGRAGEVMPEFETVSHFGALNGNSDLQSIVEANRLCNDYGLDTITTASTIACYSEFSGRRLSPEELLRHVVLIGERQGIGMPCPRVQGGLQSQRVCLSSA